MQSLSRSECRALDSSATTRYGIPSLLLMEHASLGAALLAARVLGDRVRGARVTIVCGPGNNGGDGYATARHLANAGASVSVLSLSDPPGAQGESDAGVNLRMLEKLAIAHVFVDRELPLARAPQADLLVDAIFGTGLTRPPADRYAAAIESMNAAKVPILALDLPSGLDCDLGTPLGVCIRARWTATFAAPKLGFGRAGAEQYTGAVHVLPIGLPARALPPGCPAFPPGGVPY